MMCEDTKNNEYIEFKYCYYRYKALSTYYAVAATSKWAYNTT